MQQDRGHQDVIDVKVQSGRQDVPQSRQLSSCTNMHKAWSLHLHRGYKTGKEKGPFP